MSYSSSISISFHPLVVNENDLIKRKNQRIISAHLACGIVVLILMTTGILIGVKFKERKKELINPTISENLTTTTANNQLLSSMKGRNIISSMNFTTNHSSTCPLPFYPSYNKIGITVAGTADTIGSDASHLNWPKCIYLNNERSLYIGDTGNSRIVTYSPNNTREGVTVAWDGREMNRYIQHFYINHRNNDLYFCDMGTGLTYRVQYLPLNATRFQSTVLLTGSNFDCSGMDLDDQLNIYVSERINHRVVKWLAPTYKEYVIVAGNGTSGSEMNQLNYPQGIYLDPSNNDLYVVDSMRVQLWPVGSTIGQTVLRGGLLYAMKITRDCHGNFYVLDYRSVKLFSSSVEMTGLEGEILVGIPTDDQAVQQSSEVDYFKYATDMYLDMKNGDLYVLDSSRNQVRKYTIK